MEALLIKEVLKATGGMLLQGDKNESIKNITTDSRKASHHDFFIPLVGERFDGHDFINDAFLQGAVGCLTEKKIDVSEYSDKQIIKVADTLAALQDIAKYYCEKHANSFVAVTGSVGKTTTKDMIACILEQKYKVLKTQGNFNNHIGLPLTVLGLSKNHQIAVAEMGMSGLGEISKLVSIVQPKTAVITNIGQAHIEKLGSQQNILRAKMEIFESLDEHSSAVLNGDDPLLFALQGKLPFKVLYYGIYNKQCDLLAKDIRYDGEDGSRFRINLGTHNEIIHLPVMGEHNIYNALAAIAIGMQFNVSMAQIIQALKTFKAEKMRMNIIDTGWVKVIDDCYNASPASMKAALHILYQLSGVKRRVAVLGDMLEMGEWAAQAHQKVGEEVVRCQVDYLVTVGKYGQQLTQGAVQAGMAPDNVFYFQNNAQVTGFLEGLLAEGDAILVKGSRGMKMENITRYISSIFS